MQMRPIPIALLIMPVFSTLLGDLIALRFRRSIMLLIALGAGLLLGAAFLELLPESFTLGASSGTTPSSVLGTALTAFFAFLEIQRSLDHFSAQLVLAPLGA